MLRGRSLSVSDLEKPPEETSQRKDVSKSFGPLTQFSVSEGTLELQGTSESVVLRDTQPQFGRDTQAQFSSTEVAAGGIEELSYVGLRRPGRSHEATNLAGFDEWITECGFAEWITECEDLLGEAPRPFVAPGPSAAFAVTGLAGCCARAAGPQRAALGAAAAGQPSALQQTTVALSVARAPPPLCGTPAQLANLVVLAAAPVGGSASTPIVAEQVAEPYALREQIQSLVGQLECLKLASVQLLQKQADDHKWISRLEDIVAADGRWQASAPIGGKEILSLCRSPPTARSRLLGSIFASWRSCIWDERQQQLQHLKSDKLSLMRKLDQVERKRSVAMGILLYGADAKSTRTDAKSTRKAGTATSRSTSAPCVGNPDGFQRRLDMRAALESPSNSTAVPSGLSSRDVSDLSSPPWR